MTIIKNLLSQISSTDEEFLSSLSGSVYDISRNTVRFILVELERTYGRFFNKQNVDNLDAKKNNFPTWTLEHILPQNENLSYAWMEMISPDNMDLALNIQKENMHRLGNLTLTGYNSEMSDKNFTDKRDYKPLGFTDFTGLRTKLFINQSIADQTKNEKIEDKNHRGVQNIERRTKILADLTLSKFPL